MKDWTYSHTQLDLYDLCCRRYYYRYVLGLREPPSIPASYSTWMLHRPVEAWVQYGLDPSVDWGETFTGYWAEFVTELDLPLDFDDPLYNVKNAKAMLAQWIANPIEGKVSGVESRGGATFPSGAKYVSIPDFVIENERGLSTVDLKMTSGWKVSPLSPFDDQFLGQAIPLGADGFYRVTFQGDKKSGKVAMLPPEWQPVDPVLRAEWLDDTNQAMDLIEQDRRRVRGGWRKKGNACHAFGRECPYVGRCQIGLETQRKEAA